VVIKKFKQSDENVRILFIVKVKDFEYFGERDLVPQNAQRSS